MNRLATRMSLIIIGVALLTILLALLQYYLGWWQFRQLPSELRKPLTEVNDIFDNGQLKKPAELRPQFEAIITALENNSAEVTRLDRRFRRERNGVLYGSIALLTIFSVTIGIISARRISEPISAVAAAAARIADGDLSARAEIPKRMEKSRMETATLAQNFNAMASSLEALEHERQALIADIAHELRTPLTILQGQLDAMTDGISPFTPDELGKLGAQTQLLSRLIDDLRILSLADAKRLTLKRVPVDVADLTERVVEGFQERAQRKGITLDVQTPANFIIHSDPDRLAQVLANLVDNALRYTPGGGHVCTTLSRSAGQLHLTVSDDGPGLSSEVLERAFERFYRAESSRTRASGGSGLGLAIVRTLVELQGGTVSASNNATKGATFAVTLPL